LQKLLDDEEVEPIEHSSQPDPEDAKQRQKAIEKADKAKAAARAKLLRRPYRQLPKKWLHTA
jgi:hypothetical protein